VAKCVCLCIEGGGTKTIALFADADGCILQRLERGPLNLKLSTDQQILHLLRDLRWREFQVSDISLCLAGCRTPSDCARVRALAGRVFPGARRVVVGTDLDSGFAAAFGLNESGILVISGTGSCVFGRNQRGQTARAGGWGHLLGDCGSGYWIVIANLRSAICNYDRTGKCNRTLQRALRRLCLDAPDQLVDWIQSAPKFEVAALASELVEADLAILSEAAQQLAADCAAVARRLRLAAPRVVLAGGVFANHPKFFKLTACRIHQLLPRARVSHPKYESAYGAVLLAQGMIAAKHFRGGLAANRVAAGRVRGYHDRNLGRVLTEQRNPRTMDLDKRSIPQLIDTMLDEEARVIPALRANKHAIERAVRVIVAAFKRGGRLFYIGAGTSGRLGVLDAGECPPTFSTDPEMVQGIIAGGAPALHSAVEAAEDDPLAGAEAIRNRGVEKKDVVVGIAASGNTPFVLGALDEARRLGAKTFLLCFSAPRSRLRAWGCGGQATLHCSSPPAPKSSPAPRA
jgi:N-acetylmuramic acid 6-phosphate etherase